VKVQAVDAGDPEAVIVALIARLDRARDKLARYEQLRDGLLAGRTEDEYLRDSERVGPYLTLMGGRMYEQQNIEWSTKALHILQRRQAEAGQPPAAGSASPGSRPGRTGR
jgi:hypothetical protein